MVLSATAGPAGLIIAAPMSSSGKTLVTLGLLAALTAQGIRVAPAKVGPDYIDPAFHAAACGRVGASIDGWAMTPGQIAARLARAGAGAELVLCEGVMGLMDGAPSGGASAIAPGSTAEIARMTGWPVVMVISCKGMAASTAAILAGFRLLLPGVSIAGVIFNHVGSARHRALIEDAMARHLPDVAILGFVPPLPDLALPSRHLGLVQSVEHPDLAGFVAVSARHMAAHLDLAALCRLARPTELQATDRGRIPPLAALIAVASDAAFAFCYGDLLADWREQGAEILPFSPLGGQAPDDRAGAVYLPGGYPELHGAALAGNADFLGGLRSAAGRGALIFGECGGYMVLGQSLIDRDGRAHAMAGLLPVATSISPPKRHLGYREGALLADCGLGARGHVYRGHEFHYATETNRAGPALLSCRDASGGDLGDAGCRADGVMGSFIHLLSRY